MSHVLRAVLFVGADCVSERGGPRLSDATRRDHRRQPPSVGQLAPWRPTEPSRQMTTAPTTRYVGEPPKQSQWQVHGLAACAHAWRVGPVDFWHGWRGEWGAVPSPSQGQFVHAHHWQYGSPVAALSSCVARLHNPRIPVRLLSPLIAGGRQESGRRGHVLPSSCMCRQQLLFPARMQQHQQHRRRR